jgi:hypothetical protein
MTWRAAALVLCLPMLALASVASAQSKKPAVPSAADPGGIAVALLTTGIDYTVPQVAARLARDGEGEPIAVDLLDRDNRPFGEKREQTPASHGGDGTRLALGMIDGVGDVRLVAVRVDPGDPMSLARGIAFVAQTPARVVVVPMWSARSEDWQAFRQAVQHFAHLLVIVAAGDESRNLDTTPSYPAAFQLPNVLVVTAADAGHPAGTSPGIAATANWGGSTVDAVVRARDSSHAAAVAARAAAALQVNSPALAGAELKQTLIERAPQRREGESPQRTRSLAIISPGAAAAKRDANEPDRRRLDKSRVPELAPGRPAGAPR